MFGAELFRLKLHVIWLVKQQNHLMLGKFWKIETFCPVNDSVVVLVTLKFVITINALP